MADRCGDVAFEHIRVKILSTTAADRFNEIDKMISAPAKPLHFPALPVPGDTTIKAHRPAFTINYHTHTFTPKSRHFFRIPGLAEIVYFIKNRSRGKIIVDDLRVRDVAGVIEQKPAAYAHNSTGKLVLAQTPPRYIHFVDALVARFPVAGIPVEATVVL
jgi:hypothetical protein